MIAVAAAAVFLPATLAQRALTNLQCLWTVAGSWRARARQKSMQSKGWTHDGIRHGVLRSVCALAMLAIGVGEVCAQGYTTWTVSGSPDLDDTVEFTAGRLTGSVRIIEKQNTPQARFFPSTGTAAGFPGGLYTPAQPQPTLPNLVNINVAWTNANNWIRFRLIFDRPVTNPISAFYNQDGARFQFNGLTVTRLSGNSTFEVSSPYVNSTTNAAVAAGCNNTNEGCGSARLSGTFNGGVAYDGFYAVGISSGDSVSVGFFIPGDYGDAPASYGSVSHVIGSNMSLGAAITDDPNGDYNNATAAGDADDAFGTLAAVGTGATYTLNNIPMAGVLAGAQLCGWIDFNRNGTFDGGERACTGNLGAGTATASLVWTVPTGNAFIAGPSYARFRLTTDTGQLGAANNQAWDGEVEDYPIDLLPRVNLVKALVPTTDAGRFNLTISPVAAAGTGTLNNAGNTDDTDMTAVNFATSITATETGGTVPATTLANYTPAMICRDRSGTQIASGTTSATFTTIAGAPAAAPATPAAGGDSNATEITCTATNTRRTATLQLAKSWAAGSTSGNQVTIGATTGGVNNTASFNATAPTAANSGAAVTVNVGDVIALPAETGTNVGNYTTTVACTGGHTLSGTNGQVSTNTLTITSTTAAVCTYTNTRRTSTLQLAKSWAAGSTSGNVVTIGATTGGLNNTASFNATAPTAANSGTAVTINVGDVIALPAETGTNVGNYTTTVACTGGHTLSGTNGQVSTNTLTITSTTAAVCTYTNTRRRSTLQLAKSWAAGSTSGNVVTIGATTGGLNNTASFNATAPTAANSGTAVTVNVGDVIALPAETGTNVGNYTTTVACTGGHTLSGTNGQVSTNTLTITSTTAAVCTYTNTRRTSTLQLAKSWAAGSTSGNVVTIGATTGGLNNTASFNATAPTAANSGAAVTVNTGNVIALPAETGTNVGNYTTTIACTGGHTLSGTDGQVSTNTLTITSTTAAVCTYTNTPRTATLQLAKSWATGSTSGNQVTIGATTGGRNNTASFNATAPTAADSGTAVTVNVGNVIELPAETGTDVGNYTTTVACTGGHTLSGTNGQVSTNTLTITGTNAAVCTYTNTRILAPQLTLAKTSSDTRFTVGVPASYTLTVTNTGTQATTADATVTDTVPAGLTLGTMPAGCTNSGQVVTCAIASGLAADASTSFTIPVTPTTAAMPNAVNAAQVTGGGDPLCPLPMPRPARGGPVEPDCSSTVNVPVDAAELTLTKTASAPNFTVGVPASYTLTVQNTGSAATTQAATIEDPLPAGLEPGAMPAGCVIGGRVVTCTIEAGFAAGASMSFVIPVTPTVEAASMIAIVNTATIVTGDPTCPQAGHCSGRVDVPVGAIADLQLVKRATTASVQPGQSITWTLTAHNAGPNDAADVVVSDPLPPGLQFVRASGDGWNCGISGGRVSCARAQLVNGASSVITLTLSMPAGYAGPNPVVNTATITSLTPDPQPPNNTGTETTPLLMRVMPVPALDPAALLGMILMLGGFALIARAERQRASRRR